MTDLLEEAKQALNEKLVSMKKGYVLIEDLSDEREIALGLALIYISLLETTLEHVQEMKQYWMDMTKPPTHFHIDM